jgi:hypothetical protein
LEEASEWKIPSLAMRGGTFDAVLYMGPPSGITFSRISAALCADTAGILRTGPR